jgi:hypothetical protein
MMNFFVSMVFVPIGSVHVFVELVVSRVITPIEIQAQGGAVDPSGTVSLYLNSVVPSTMYLMQTYWSTLKLTLQPGSVSKSQPTESQRYRWAKA